MSAIGAAGGGPDGTDREIRFHDRVDDGVEPAGGGGCGAGGDGNDVSGGGEGAARGEAGAHEGEVDVLVMDHVERPSEN